MHFPCGGTCLLIWFLIFPFAEILATTDSLKIQLPGDVTTIACKKINTTFGIHGSAWNLTFCGGTFDIVGICLQVLTQGQTTRKFVLISIIYLKLVFNSLEN